MNELELIKAVKNSDSAAFKELSRLYYQQLYGFVWRRIGNPDNVKDILQDLFLNVWKLRSGLDEKKSIKPYLFASANNLIKNYLKSKTLKNERSSDINPDELSHGNNPEQDINTYLEEALSGIPEKLRIVFIMNKFEGFKYSEIAEMLDISEKTVESRMSKILKFLRIKFNHLMVLIFIFFIQSLLFFSVNKYIITSVCKSNELKTPSCENNFNKNNKYNSGFGYCDCIKKMKRNYFENITGYYKS